MLNSKELNPLTKLINEGSSIFQKVKDKFDWNKIDMHESLTFLNKNYHRKPSDIAKIIIVLLSAIFLLIEGFRTVTILMCYILPICIMVMKISQAMRYERLRSKEPKIRMKESVSEGKSTYQKNNSELSSSSKDHDKKVESQKQQSELLLQSRTKSSELTQNSRQEAQNKPLQQSDDRKAENEGRQSINQLCKLFIIYFVINLILDLTEPILLLILQSVFNFVEIMVSSLWSLITEGNIWSLVLFPFEFIFSFIFHVITLNQVSSISTVSLIALRVVFSAFLLNMSKNQRRFFQKYLYEKNWNQIPLRQPIDQRPKTE